MKAMNQRFKINYHYLTLFILFVITTFDGFAAEPHKASHFQAVAKVLNQFKRRVTVLELGSADYSLDLAKNKAVCVVLMSSGAQATVDKIKAQEMHGITVLAPASCGKETIKNLGRCEHFDIVIVHEGMFSGVENAEVIALYKELGEYVFVESSKHVTQEMLIKQQFESVDTNKSGKNTVSTLFLAHKPKTFLDIARYSQRDKPKSIKPKYFVKSNFDKKFFSKKSDKRLVPWVDGINLVTFSMLKGIYPEDDSIRAQIAAMQKTHPHHTDLVIGNIIVQGDKLIPIDCADSRRCAKISKCIGAALTAFKKGNKRLQNPFKWIDDYYEMVSA